MIPKFETQAIRIQMEQSQFQEHSSPLYLTSSFVFEDAGVPFLHYYSMGKADNIKAIAEEIF